MKKDSDWFQYDSAVAHTARKKCVNKVMRLILYKIISSIIRLTQHCSIQNSIPLMQHILSNEISTPHNRIRSQFLLGS
jgi:hypothetical protein